MMDMDENELQIFDNTLEAAKFVGNTTVGPKRIKSCM
jgi:hypothetical protein